MNPLLERYPDLLGEQDEPALLACVADLDATCARFTLPPECDAELARSLSAHAHHPSRTGPRTILSRRPALSLSLRAARWRLAPILMATLLVGGGTAAYLHASGPTPVDAQTVLHRAADASPGANEATHATYHVSSSDGRTGSADIWIGYDGSAAAHELALTLSMIGNGSSRGDMRASVVEVGPNLLQLYQPDGGAAAQIPAQSTTPPPPAAALAPDQALKGIVVGTLLAQKLSKQPDAYTLQQETLDGIPVYALQRDGDGAGSGVTYYFNAQSYVLEGADWGTPDGVTWKVRLDPGSTRTIPLSVVPAGTFGAGIDEGKPGVGQRITVTSRSVTRQP